MKIVSQLAVGLLGLVMALGSVGCESKPSMGEFNVTVTLADGFNPARDIEVDLVGVAEGRDLNAMEEVTVSNYFKAMNEFRASQKYRIPLVFRKDGPRSQTVDLTRRGPYYATWKNANVMHMVALARLDEPTGPDRRRAVLPLDKRRWKTKNLTVVIDKAEVSPVPAPEVSQ